VETTLPGKVLIVDDSLLVRAQVVRALTGAGFAVVEANDGVDGLAKLSANPDVGLVVCDVNMPRMSGLELLERTPAGLAVLMLTTEGHSELIQRARALGAKGWITKPFDADLLVATVRKLLG
jgi:two-component system chemotaxis response regulator CheY